MSFDARGDWIDDGVEFVVVREWCPTCDPDGIPEPWTPKYCALHYIRWDGADDAGVDSGAFLSGSAEAGGEENRVFNNLIHRRTR